MRKASPAVSRREEEVPRRRRDAENQFFNPQRICGRSCLMRKASPAVIRREEEFPRSRGDDENQSFNPLRLSASAGETAERKDRLPRESAGRGSRARRRDGEHLHPSAASAGHPKIASSHAFFTSTDCKIASIRGFFTSADRKSRQPVLFRASHSFFASAD